MDISPVGQSAQVQSQVAVEKKALKSQEAVVAKIFQGIEQTPIVRSSAYNTGHNLNIRA